MACFSTTCNIAMHWEVVNTRGRFMEISTGATPGDGYGWGR